MMMSLLSGPESISGLVFTGEAHFSSAFTLDTKRKGLRTFQKYLVEFSHDT
jgi:hypothetical protein